MPRQPTQPTKFLSKNWFESAKVETATVVSWRIIAKFEPE